MIKIDERLSSLLRKSTGSRMVRISEKLFQHIQTAAEPLEDDFESACWKMLKGREYMHDKEVD